MSFWAKLLKFVVVFVITFLIMCITYTVCTVCIQKKWKNWRVEFKKVLSESWPILLTIALAITLVNSDLF